MSKASKVWLIVAAALVLCGGILFTCALTGVNWNFSNFSTENYETKVYEFDEGLGTIDGDIYIETATADVEIVASSDMAIDTVKVVCYENSKDPHHVSLSDGVLTIDYEDTREWIDFIGGFYETPKVTIYLPLGTWGRYGDLSIKTSTGDVVIPHGLCFDAMEIETSTGGVNNRADVFGSMEIETNTGDINIEESKAFSMKLSASTGTISLQNVECHHELNIRVSTGRTEMKDVFCETFISKGTTGDIYMEKLHPIMQATVERSTGDVTFRSFEGANFRVFTDTGDVDGSFVSDMIVNAETDTGDVDIPKCAVGGNCYINTNTGDIRIEIEKQ